MTRPLVRALQAAVLALAPHGGQHAARRNAWAGMSTDAARARARREADAAVAAALLRASRPERAAR
ncbi:MAG TPA: hypothetical protein VNU66_02315 [Mycobacteriales bacterium]|nr:hypothetical protein [Mycobacteriales bacterium]